MNGEYLVSGPGTEGKAAASASHGCAIAQTLAGKAKADGTWYVRRPDGTVAYHVTADHGVIYTRAATGDMPEPRKRTQATATTLEEAL